MPHGMVRPAIWTASHICPPRSYRDNLNLASKKLECLSSLKKCSSMKEIFQVHAQIQIFGLHRDPNLMDEIIQFCASRPSGSLSHGRLLVEYSDNLAVPSWNKLIRGYATSSFPIEAIRVFLAMRFRGVWPSRLTYPFLFKACTTLLALKEGQQIHVDTVKHGLDSDVYVRNTLIRLYGSCGEFVDARQVFEEMTHRTIVSWNSVISAGVENLKFFESMALFVRMRDSGFEPDETTMVILLSACAEVGNLDLGKCVHSQVIEKGLLVNCELGTSLVNMYAKCGDLYCASQVFDRMIVGDVWTWSSLIMGLAQHGLAKDALHIFKRMQHCGIQPNHVTFLGILCACSHARLVEEGRQFFHDMQHVYGIKPTMALYGAMVDCLGRACHLREAYDFVINMPVEPDAVVWRTLLSACNIHDCNDSGGVGEKVRKKLFELEPKRSGNFVMISNKYAEVGMWEKMHHVRSAMRDGGLKKVAGMSYVQVGGSTYRFLSRDHSQVNSENIYLLLDGLYLHIKDDEE
ncbi:pentatricopeptide repeat-containing protein At2g36730 [Diospyros lotus]|uniref:pentatricopeptide repeat-containing protein At2g36730 n=1 Tax=Diospyros lotus TaxID=55363 RepID=UPI0022568ABA|nr:pentatricopeptide repeat-containing protein At2g36730 [Diospyros lotus]